MRVYLETGIFIDYLTARGNGSLRTTGRRGRTLAQIAHDAERVVECVSRNHESATSCLTFYEAEEALYKELFRVSKGTAHASTLLVPAARSLMIQLEAMTNLFGIQKLDLSSETIRHQLQTLEFQVKGIRAADALHLATAMQTEADLVISADDDIIQMDGLIATPTGKKLRCVDSDAAIPLL
jgi:PIN domain